MAEKKSTLEFLNVKACKLGQLHIVWQNLSSPLEIQKATVKAQHLVNRYPLATSPTSGVIKNDVCPLCKEEPETTTHFLLQYSTLSPVRLPYIIRILELCRQQTISIDPETLTRIILDSTHLPIPNTMHETTCRNLVFKLHNTRAKILGGESGYMRSRIGSKTAKFRVHARANRYKAKYLLTDSIFNFQIFHQRFYCPLTLVFFTIAAKPQWERLHTKDCRNSQEPFLKDR